VKIPACSTMHAKAKDDPTVEKHRTILNIMTMRGHRADLNPPKGEFASGDVCRLARVSLRQLQWWDEREVISPHQQGHRRVYVVSDVIGMMVVGELRRKGLSLQKIRRIVRSIRREIERHIDKLLTGKSELYVLTDGRSSFLEDQPERIVELLKNSREPLSLVSVSDQAKRLSEFQLVGSRKRRRDQLKLF
jgi:DNA-binding transcriptional MerR regulator